MTVRAGAVVVLALVLAGCAEQKAPPAAGASYAAELARVEASTDRALGATSFGDDAAADDTAAEAAEEDAPLSEQERRALLRDAERVFSSKNTPSAAGARLLRQDLAERSARVALSIGDPEEALRWIERGLAVDRTPSLVLGNLLVGRADVLEVVGRPDEARSSLVEALGVNQALLARELAE